MRRVMLLAVALLPLTACGDDPPLRKPGSAAAITVKDYRYTPQDVSVRRGQVFLAVRNAGSVPTSFEVRRGGRERGRISTLDPGELGTLVVRLRPGTYIMAGAARHEAAGERGTLTVR